MFMNYSGKNLDKTLVCAYNVSEGKSWQLNKGIKSQITRPTTLTDELWAFHVPLRRWKQVPNPRAGKPVNIETDKAY